ncbi:MAG: hypothetical protein Q7S87_11310 [Agitococcus sp.]|nr:hypothetical protein [Agitococcus sp.]
MNSEIQQLASHIRQLQSELQNKVHEQEAKTLYILEGKKIAFETHVRDAHRKLRVNTLRWLASSSWRHLVSAPFIYSMIFPFALLDLTLWLYQSICFRLYRIPRVSRRDYIVIDRHLLGYLNPLEKLNCLYCSYANGLIAYAREITARTEQYWCPIKHALHVADPHDRYTNFLPYGDTTNLHENWQKLREDLSKTKSPDH